MKTVIIFIILSFNLGFAQNCFDETKEVKKILRSSGVEMHDAKIIGACVDYSSQMLHLTITLDPLTVYSYSQFVPMENYFALLTLEPFFTSAKKIYEKLLMLKNYTLYIVEFKNVVDQYGNFSHKEKKILSTIGMSSETALKINWKYVKDKLFTTFANGKDEDKILFIKMLDHYEVNPF